MAHIHAASIIASHLTELLNTEISMMQVYDEMLLIEHSQCGDDKMLNRMIKKIMADNMRPQHQSDYQKLNS